MILPSHNSKGNYTALSLQQKDGNLHRRDNQLTWFAPSVRVYACIFSDGEALIRIELWRKNQFSAEHAQLQMIKGVGLTSMHMHNIQLILCCNLYSFCSFAASSMTHCRTEHRYQHQSLSSTDGKRNWEPARSWTWMLKSLIDSTHNAKYPGLQHQWSGWILWARYLGHQTRWDGKRKRASISHP